MYYVLWVGTGNETKAETMIRQLVPDMLYSDCFYPVKHLRLKSHRGLRDVYQRVLPGYLFIVSENIRPLYQELKKLPVFLNLLGKEELDEAEDFYPLTEKEEAWLKQLSGQMTTSETHTHVMELSQVAFDEDDRVVIVSGPLLDMEGKVRKINLHKRIAEVEVDFMNAPIILHLGIELLKKQIT